MTYRPSGLRIRLIGMLPTSCFESALGEIHLPVINGAFDCRDAACGTHPPTSINPERNITNKTNRIAALYPIRCRESFSQRSRHFRDHRPPLPALALAEQTHRRIPRAVGSIEHPPP